MKQYIFICATCMYIGAAYADVGRFHDIHDAVRAGNLKQVRTILMRNPYVVNWHIPVELNEQGNLVEDAGYAPVHIAAEQGYTEILQLLLKKGARPNSYTLPMAEYYTTPLHIAAAEGNVQAISMLVDGGAFIDVKDSEYDTPLYESVHEKQYEAAKKLLVLGASANVPDEEGNTPLHIAADEGLHDFTRLLLAYGANPTLRNNYGETPAHIAQEVGYTRLAKELRVAEHAVRRRVYINV